MPALAEAILRAVIGCAPVGGIHVFVRSIFQAFDLPQVIGTRSPPNAKPDGSHALQSESPITRSGYFGDVLKILLCNRQFSACRNRLRNRPRDLQCFAAVLEIHDVDSAKIWRRCAPSPCAVPRHHRSHHFENWAACAYDLVYAATAFRKP